MQLLRHRARAKRKTRCRRMRGWIGVSGRSRRWPAPATTIEAGGAANPARARPTMPPARTRRVALHGPKVIEPGLDLDQEDRASPWVEGRQIDPAAGATVGDLHFPSRFQAVTPQTPAGVLAGHDTFGSCQYRFCDQRLVVAGRNDTSVSILRRTTLVRDLSGTGSTAAPAAARAGAGPSPPAPRAPRPPRA